MTDDATKPAARKPRKRTKSYPGSITKRGDTWRLRLCVNGKYQSFTTEGTKVDAQNFATAKYAELTGDAQREKQGIPGRVPFSQLLKEFLTYEVPTRAKGTQRSYTSSCDNFRTFFVDQRGDPSVRDIRRSQVATYLEWRRTSSGTEKPASGHTVARDRRVLLRLFNYALGKEYVDSNPVKFARVAKADPRNPSILSAEQYEALLAAAQPNAPLWLYILLLGETGVRAYTEALAIEWRDVDFTAGAHGAITLRSEPSARNKSGKTRVIPMTKRLAKALKDHAARFQLAHRSVYVFTHERTIRSAKEGERVVSFRDSFNAAAKAAKLPKGFRKHDLRHRRVTVWLGEGKSPVLVQSAMGHASISTTMGYTHLTAAHLRSLVEDAPATVEKPAQGSATATA